MVVCVGVIVGVSVGVSVGVGVGVSVGVSVRVNVGVGVGSRIIAALGTPYSLSELNTPTYSWRLPLPSKLKNV